MSTRNLAVSDRKFTEFNARLDGNTVILDGEYAFTLNNEGLAPTGSLQLSINDVSIDGTEVSLLSDESKSIDRIRPMSSTEVSVLFDIESESSTVLNTVEAACDDESFSVSTEMTITGIIFSAEASSTGVYPIISQNCDLSESQPVTPPNPPIQIPEPPRDRPDNGDGEEDNGEDSNDGENGEQDESSISGPNIVSTNQTERYTWSDFPNDTENIEWAVLSERQDPNPENTELVLADENIRDRIELDFTAYIDGDFLIVIQSYDSQGQLLTEGQKVVTVIPEQG